MARPQRNNVDYFPFLCEEGNKMFYLEETYGNDGFAVFVKLLRELAKADYHYLNLSKTTTLMFLSAKCKVSKEILEAIINDLVDLEKFDAELWNENKIIFCQDFIDSIQDAYSKRLNKCIDRNGLILLLQAKGIRKQDKSIPKQSKSNSEGVGNTQSIVEYNKEKESEKEILHPLEVLTKENNLQEWFLEWFNKHRTRLLEIPSNFKKLQSNDIYNLTKLNNTYDQKDFEKALKSICMDKWACENDLVIPKHFLNEDNFVKYLNATPKTHMSREQKKRKGWTV